MWTLHRAVVLHHRSPREHSNPSEKVQRTEAAKPASGTPLWTDFDDEELQKFPALKKRNFWCIQRHQARALHYDLRMQLDGGTFSWAIPKGLIGISKSGESSRLAVETTIHPISYTTYEGADGQVLPSGRRTGTMLWDVGEYTIDDETKEARDRIRAFVRNLDVSVIAMKGTESRSQGAHEEDKLRHRLRRPIRPGSARSIHFTLKGGSKMTNHSFILLLPSTNSRSRAFVGGGREKKTWFVRLPKQIESYPWDRGGEEGAFWNRSVKSARTFDEVLKSRPVNLKLWQSELKDFAGFADKLDELPSG